MVGTFVEAAWGEAGDLRQDWEEGPQTGPLWLPALKDFEDALGHISDLLLSVPLQIKHRWHGKADLLKCLKRHVIWSENIWKGNCQILKLVTLLAALMP